jgi:hypothetical protein
LKNRRDDEDLVRLHESGGGNIAATSRIPDRFVSYKKNQQSERSGLVQQQDMSRQARHILIC